MGLPHAAAVAAPPGQGRVTLDELFRRAAARRPGAIALADAPNRQKFTDGAPLRLSYAEADRMISAIAGRLRRMGLPTDAIVGIQMPNIVENVLTILGVLRAGLIAAPLPLLWRRADMVTALARVGAKALITCRRAGGFEHCQLGHCASPRKCFRSAMSAASAPTFPTASVPFDDLFTAAKLDAVPPLDRDSDAAAHLAVTTFEVGEDGPVPVARRHLELLAGGLCALLEEPDGAGRQRAVRRRAGVLCRHLPYAGTVAPERRHAVAPSPVRSARSSPASAATSVPPR